MLEFGTVILLSIYLAKWVLKVVSSFVNGVQGGCRTGMAKMTNGYDLPARYVIFFRRVSSDPEVVAVYIFVLANNVSY
jgi:hypothetical protein